MPFTETFDHGPINTWDRVPYTTTVLDQKKAMLLPMENFVSKCLVMSNYFSVWPIDHDDGSSYWADSYNFLTYGGWKNYLGHSKKALNNVYAYPDKYMSDHYCMDSRGQQLGSGMSYVLFLFIYLVSYLLFLLRKCPNVDSTNLRRLPRNCKIFIVIVGIYVYIKSGFSQKSYF